MRTEWSTSGSGNIKGGSGSLNNFTDAARLDKVAGLRKSLAENSYHVSAADVAEKVIDHMLQLPT